MTSQYRVTVWDCVGAWAVYHCASFDAAVKQAESAELEFAGCDIRITGGSDSEQQEAEAMGYAA